MTAKNNEMVMAVFRDHGRSQMAYDWLTSRGYTSDEINLMMSNDTRTRYYTPSERAAGKDKEQAGTMAEEGVAIGGAVGTAVGATLGAIAAIGINVLIPGLGLVVAGPIVAGLAGAGAGATAGGLIGGLVGLGIPESNATAYEKALKEGGVVIGVRPHKKDADDIKSHFEKIGGENVICC